MFCPAKIMLLFVKPKNTAPDVLASNPDFNLSLVEGSDK
jgi:hypothetical protein